LSHVGGIPSDSARTAPRPRRSDPRPPRGRPGSPLVVHRHRDRGTTHYVHSRPLHALDVPGLIP
jgi:hypothetical protein